MWAHLVWAAHTAAGHGAVVGFGTAFAVDVHTFLSWKKLDDATKWDWRTAILRWVQGVIYGGAVGAGYGGLVS